MEKESHENQEIQKSQELIDKFKELKIDEKDIKYMSLKQREQYMIYKNK